MMCEIQCVAGYSSAGHEIEYYLLDESSTVILPTSSILEVHNVPPFEKEMVRVTNASEGSTRIITEEVRNRYNTFLSCQFLAYRNGRTWFV
jgi:hypothetical protein